MLEGLEISVVALPEVIASAETHRFDPEYFQKQHLADSLLVTAKRGRFETFADMGLRVDASAFYPAIEEYYGAGDLPFLRVSDVDTVIDFEACTRIPSELCDRFPTLSQVHPGDIVFTKGGSVARIGLVTQRAAVSRDLIFIDSSKLSEADRVFLYLYARTDFFNRMLLRSSSQTAQPHLTITLVRNLPNFRALEALKRRCVTIVQRAYAVRAEAIERIRDGGAALTAALGLGDWEPPEPLTYTRRASEAFSTERLDAEYFQPKYKELLKRVKRTGHEVVPLQKLILPVKNGYDYRDFTETGTPYIRVGDISHCRLHLETAARVPIGIKEVGKNIALRVGDVLFTRKGSFGNAAPVRDGETHAIISSEIMLVRLCDDAMSQIIPEYLAVFLNSLAGRYQAEQWAHGAAFYSIAQDDLGRFFIPLLPMNVQTYLKTELSKSEAARQRAQALLDAAKHAVEIAIEDSETEALAYLETQGVQ